MVAALAVTGIAPTASAQVLSRFALRGEFGAGTMISAHQQDVLGYDSLAIQATGRLGITLADPLVLQIGVSNWFFPAANDANGVARETGRVLAPMAGLRVEPRIGRVGRLFFEVNGGYAFTGDDQRLTLDGGLGFEFEVTRAFHIGPALRYGMVFQQAEVSGVAQPFPDANAMYVSAGLSIALRYPPDEATAARDTDGDGVLDPQDQCVDVPQGQNPDPARPGCPRGDRDSDGVFDDNDQCPDVAQGDHPDPNRNGCPLQDRDSDGVLDSDDQCPDQAQGQTPDPARRGCPAGDRDSDGVIDPEDQCVDVPAGPRPSTVRRGCPMPDADHDGIIDQPEGPDQCPDRPETFNGNADDDGCPDGAALAEQVGTQIRILQQINFRTDSDEITGRQSFQVLDSVVAILRAMVNISQVDIQGHTDDRGAADHNRDLSNRRAAAVVRYVTDHGIDAGRLASHGFGPDCPMQQGTSRAARAANRRVQFVIVSSETPAGQCVGGSVAGTPAATATPGAPAAAEEPAGRHGRRHHRRH